MKKNTNPDLWPDFEIIWDTSEEHKFRATDYSKEDYDTWYTEKLVLGYVDFKQLYWALPNFPMFRWKRSTIWKNCQSHKLQKALEYWITGNRMTPPLISFNKNIVNPDGNLVIQGGFHHLMICFVKQPKTIPILVPQNMKENVGHMLSTILWEN